MGKNCSGSLLENILRSMIYIFIYVFIKDNVLLINVCLFFSRKNTDSNMSGKNNSGSLLENILRNMIHVFISLLELGTE